MHRMVESNELSSRIRTARERAGKNKNQVARALGVSWQHYDHWERGRVEPSLSSLRRLSKVLEVSTDYLLGLGEEPQTTSAIERFLGARAPVDLTPEEERWLRSAPVDHDVMRAGDYGALLENLRSISTGAPAAPPKSGPRPRVDRDAIEAATPKTGTHEK